MDVIESLEQELESLKKAIANHPLEALAIAVGVGLCFGTGVLTAVHLRKGIFRIGAQVGLKVLRQL